MYTKINLSQYEHKCFSKVNLKFPATMQCLYMSFSTILDTILQTEF